jgi:hypothetical protein
MVEDIDEIVGFYGLAVNPQNGKIVSPQAQAKLRKRKLVEAEVFDARMGIAEKAGTVRAVHVYEFFSFSIPKFASFPLRHIERYIQGFVESH